MVRTLAERRGEVCSTASQGTRRCRFVPASFVVFVRPGFPGTGRSLGGHTMGNPVVHYEIRARDPDAARAFYGKLFGWTYPPGGEPGYTYVETGVAGGIPGGIGKAQAGNGHVTFFVGVPDVAASLA